MIDRAKNILPESTLTVCNAEILHYDSSSFEVVVGSEMIYYLKYPMNFIKEAIRVLKSEGKLILIWGNKYYNFLYNIASYLKLRAYDPFALQTSTKKELIELINDIFCKSSIDYYGIGLPGSLNGSDNIIIANCSPVNGIVVQKV